MTRKQAVRAIVLNGDKLLAMKRNKFGRHYHTLIGGFVDIGEDLQTALRREIREETGMQVGAMREVFTEDAGDLYGVQHVFLCEYNGGDPVMPGDSDEAHINALGQNMYEPVWLPVADIPRVNFRSASLAEALQQALQQGFPETPQTLAWKAESVAQ